MPVKKQPVAPAQPSVHPKHTEVIPPVDPDEIIVPEEEDPDIIPDEDPFETPPYEAPPPGEGP